MEQSEKELRKQAELLFKEEKYHDVILALPDELLEKYNNAGLHVTKARAYSSLEKFEDSLISIQKALDIDSTLAWAFASRGYVWYRKKEYEKAIENFNQAIALDRNYTSAYNSRGSVFYDLKDFDKALEDYHKAIELDESYAFAYHNRGRVWVEKKEYDKALEDYNKAIQLDKNYSNAYNSRGIVWHEKKEYKKALDDYNKVIQLNEKHRFVYYNRAKIYDELGEYNKAIIDYRKYIEFRNDPSDYFTKVALSEIERLTKSIDNEWYSEIEKIVSQIKKILIFDKKCITHYTSLSATKAMILGKSPFRLSEGAYLNDTSEGKELFKYLLFEIPKSTKDGTIEEEFTEKPFIGSFVAENKHNDLTLWRMYGKEAQVEAKGCALTIDKGQFINKFEAKLVPSGNNENIIPQSEGKNAFYKVAYLNNEEFIIPNSNKKDIKLLKELLQSLKENVRKLEKEQREKITKLLNDIAYLFKSAEYQYEYEIRLVIQGVGIKKEFNSLTDKDDSIIPPRVYIDMIEIAPVIEKITLGPKVERADEWAAAFNYYMKENYKKKAEIIISHLPFK